MNLRLYSLMGILLILGPLSAHCVQAFNFQNKDQFNAPQENQTENFCSSARLFKELRRLLGYSRIHNCEIQLFERESSSDPEILVLNVYVRDLSLCRSIDCSNATVNFVLGTSKRCLQDMMISTNLSKLQWSYGYQTETEVFKKTLVLKPDVFGTIWSMELMDRIGENHRIIHRANCRPEF